VGATELIFFGRHERRKGFSLFVDAVASLPPTLQPDLTFLGRFDKVDLEFSGSYALRKLRSYQGRIRFFDDLTQEAALARILHSRAALCVMPSLIENSPCVVGECFTLGVPFLATDVGGTAELIAPESHSRCLVAPNARALAAALERTLTEGLAPLRSSLSPQDIADRWKRFLFELRPPSQKALTDELPLVSVCVVHYERPELLSRAIQSLLNQTYRSLEIMVVDDGSKQPSAHAYLRELEHGSHRFPIKVIRSHNRYLGAARNLAASHARGEYIIFNDDDNFAEPTEVELFVRAALSSECDILTCQYYIFRDASAELSRRKIEYFPIGIGGIYSVFRNRFGDANALFRRSTFEQLGGFSELHGVGWEDWELFLRASLRGVKIGVVPEPLFNYRASESGMLATTSISSNFERLFSMLDAERPRLNADIVRYANRSAVQQLILDRTWSLLAKEPCADLHQQLLAHHPASTEARLKLSDLAFGLGRVADALEIGLSDPGQREKLLALAAQLSRPSLIAMRNRLYFTPPRDDGVLAVGLKGWAFDKEGRGFVPKLLEIENQRFITVGYVRSHRSDVADRYKLKSSEHGFTLVAIPFQTSNDPELRTPEPARPIGASPPFEIRTLDEMPLSCSLALALSKRALSASARTCSARALASAKVLALAVSAAMSSMRAFSPV
jgi:glycosyltransferase involved in cell wall biosynthesis